MGCKASDSRGCSGAIWRLLTVRNTEISLLAVGSLEQSLWEFSYGTSPAEGNSEKSQAAMGSSKAMPRIGFSLQALFQSVDEATFVPSLICLLTA